MESRRIRVSLNDKWDEIQLIITHTHWVTDQLSTNHLQSNKTSWNLSRIVNVIVPSSSSSSLNGWSSIDDEQNQNKNNNKKEFQTLLWPPYCPVQCSYPYNRITDATDNHVAIIHLKGAHV